VVPDYQQNAGANQLTHHEQDPLAHPRGEELLLASASAPQLGVEPFILSLSSAGVKNDEIIYWVQVYEAFPIFYTQSHCFNPVSPIDRGVRCETRENLLSGASPHL
jgi:hypothetical protein